jgi:hypothetical protein
MRAATRAQERHGGHRRQTRGQAGKTLRAHKGERGHASHHRSAVHHGERFLGAQHDGLEPRLGERRRRVHAASLIGDDAFADECGHDIAERREIAARSDGALGWNERQDVLAEHLGEQPRQFLRDARPAARQRRQANGQDCARLFGRQHAAHAAAVKA